MKIITNIMIIILSNITMNISLYAQSKKITLTNESFDMMIEIWKLDIDKKPLIMLSSSPEPYMDLESFQEIMNYKTQAIPYFIKKMQNGDRGLFGTCYWGAVRKISKKRYEDDIRWAIMREEKTLFYTYIDWWENGEEEDIETFNSLYASYQQTNDSDEKQKILTKIQHLGIRVLPLAVEKFNQGDDSFVNVIEHLTDKEYQQQFKDRTDLNTREKIQQWWQTDKDRWIVKPKEQDNQ